MDESLPTSLSSCVCKLNPGRVEHDADPFPHGAGGQVLGEFGSDCAAAAVGPGHFAPNHPKLVGLVVGAWDASGFLGLVDVGTLLAKIEVSVSTPGHALKLEQGGVFVLTAETALVPSKYSLHIETAWCFDSTWLLGSRALFHGSLDFRNFRHLSSLLLGGIKF